MSSIRGRKSRSEVCREFGLVMALAFCVLGGILLYKGRSGSLLAFLVMAGFVLSALYFPLRLSTLERWWMAFAEKLSIVMSTLIMFITFYAVITPMGLFLRLLKKDLLDVKIDRERSSYWLEVEKEGPATRHYTPY